MKLKKLNQNITEEAITIKHIFLLNGMVPRNCYALFQMFICPNMSLFQDFGFVLKGIRDNLYYY